MKPGTYDVSGSTSDRDFIFDVQDRRIGSASGKPPLTLEGGGAVIRQIWQTTDDGAIDRTLMPAFRFLDCDDLIVRGLTFDYFPRVYTQGVVTDVAATNFKVRIDPAFTPAFGSMDFFGLVNPVTGAFEQTQNDADADQKIQPYPINFTGTAGIYQCNPPAHSETITGTFSKNPLTLTPSAPTTFVAGDTVRALGFTGLTKNGTSVVNQKEFGVEIKDGNIILLDAGGQKIDASDASDMTGTGTLRLVSVPAWVVPGALVYILCRKRAGNPFFLRGCKRPTLDLTFRSSAALAVLGIDLEDPTIDIVARGDGLVASNAGLILLTDVRGTFRSNLLDARGICDDLVNVRTRTWAGQVSNPSGNTLTATFSNSQWQGTAPTLPKVGDSLEILPPSLASPFMLNITAVGPSTVTGPTQTAPISLSGNLPPGFNPTTWLIVNRSIAAAWRVGTVRLHGGAARAIVPQSADWQVERLLVRGTRGPAVRHLFPAVDDTLNYAGAKGGGYIGEIVAESVVFNYRTTNNAAVVARALNLTGDPVAQPTGWKPVVVGTLTASDYGFGAVAAQGIDVIVHSAVLLDGGTRRATIVGLAPPLSGAVDYHAEQARLDVLSDPNSQYLPVGYAGAGGQVTLPPGSARTVLATTFATASTTPVLVPGLAVPVRAGRLYTIRCLVRFRSAAAATGAGFSFEPPGVPSLFVDTWQIANTGQGTTAPTFSQGRTAGFGAVSSGVDLINADLFATCDGLIQPGSDGVLSVRVRSGVSGSSVSVMSDSVLIVSEVR